MADLRQDVLTDLARLPPVGTPERRGWDLTIRDVNELYPDWSAINLGKAHLLRETYERYYRDYYERDACLLGSVPGPGSSGDEGSWEGAR